MQTYQAIAIVGDKLSRWAQGVVAIVPNLAAAVLIIIGFWLASKIARNIVARVAGRVTRSPQAARLLSQVSAFALMVAGVFVALGVLGLEKTVTSLLTANATSSKRGFRQA